VGEIAKLRHTPRTIEQGAHVSEGYKGNEDAAVMQLRPAFWRRQAITCVKRIFPQEFALLDKQQAAE